jgi:hypothetical protein
MYEFTNNSFSPQFERVPDNFPAQISQLSDSYVNSNLYECHKSFLPLILYLSMLLPPTLVDCAGKKTKWPNSVFIFRSGIITNQ